MTSRINMNLENFRAANAGHDIIKIHPDDAEQAFHKEMQLVGVWFGKDQGINECGKCGHGIEFHKIRFANPVGSDENRFEWIGCSQCSEGDETILMTCFGEQA